MAFLKLTLHDETSWWLWDKSTMEAININGGGFTIDENAEYFMNAEVFEGNSWFQLYKEKGYSPLIVSIKERDVWVDPDGNYWYGDAHGVQAVYICQICYDEDHELSWWEDAEQSLIDKGWKKLTCGAMWKYYVQDTYVGWKVTPKQARAIRVYCEYHNIMEPDMSIAYQ